MRVNIAGLVLAAAVVTVLSACESNDNDLGQPNSELAIVQVAGNQTISTPSDRGAINLIVNQDVQLRVMRTVRDDDGSEVTTNVTAQSDFNFTNPSVAAMDVSGQLTALAEGFTTLEVVYRDDNLPSDDDSVALDITVRGL